MRQSTPPLHYVHPRQTALFGGLGIAVEGSMARAPGDNRFAEFNSVALPTVQLDPYGRATYFEVFCTGSETTSWNVTTESFVNVTQSEGVLCPSCDETGDKRIYISINWDLAPEGSGSTLMNFSVEHSGKLPSQHSAPPVIELFYNHTSLPSHFTAGFIETQNHISIEAEHFTRQTAGDSLEAYTLLPGYGRTLGAVSLSNHTIQRLTPDTAPILEYDFYKFSEAAEIFNVTMIMGTGLNNHPGSPLTYAIQFDDIDKPLKVEYIGEAPPGRGARPEGWADSVRDAAWVHTTEVGHGARQRKAHAQGLAIAARHSCD
jgi:hypothetical protein